MENILFTQSCHDFLKVAASLLKIIVHIPAGTGRGQQHVHPRGRQRPALLNRVRQGICQLDLAWRVGGTDAAKLLGAIVPDKVNVRYFDPRTNSYAEAEMYVEDRSCSLVSFKDDEDAEANLWDVSFSLVQY